MNFHPGDIVCLAGDGRRLVVVSRLDSRLIWVRLSDADADCNGDLYAFRVQDLRLISRGEPLTAVSLIPQIVRAAEPADVIAA